MNTPLRTAILGTTALGLALWLAAATSHARASDGAFDLITSNEARLEAQAEASAPPANTAPRTRSLVLLKPDQPSIQVDTPTAASAAANAPGAHRTGVQAGPRHAHPAVDPRVLYGLPKIDLTDRLEKHATVTEEGVVVDRAQVPAGQHRLFMQVTDDQGNLAEQALRLRIGSGT